MSVNLVLTNAKKKKKFEQNKHCKYFKKEKFNTFKIKRKIFCRNIWHENQTVVAYFIVFLDMKQLWTKKKYNWPNTLQSKSTFILPIPAFSQKLTYRQINSGFFLLLDWRCSYSQVTHLCFIGDFDFQVLLKTNTAKEEVSTE